MKPCLFAACSAAAILLSGAVACAQELEPRAYSPAPIGTNFAIAALSHSSGDLLFDPSLPVTDTGGSINTLVTGYVRTFALGTRAASMGAMLPYARANLSGNLAGTPSEVHRSGMGDLRLRFAMNLIGGDALSPQEFARRKPASALGASLSMVAPTGQYDSSRLINISSNRWAFKPEIGISHPIGDLFLEAAAGLWLFTDNTDFAGGQTRSQEPLATYQLHAGYTFRPGLWLAADATYYTGGQTSIDGSDKQDLQENSRYGVTLSIPINASWSAKVAWASALSTRIGGEFDVTTLAIQYRWFDRQE